MQNVLCIIILILLMACNPPDPRKQTGSRIFDSLCAAERKKFDSIRSVENIQSFFLKEQRRDDSVKNAAMKKDTAKSTKKENAGGNKEPKAGKKNTKPAKKKKKQG